MRGGICFFVQLGCLQEYGFNSQLIFENEYLPAAFADSVLASEPPCEQRRDFQRYNAEAYACMRPRRGISLFSITFYISFFFTFIFVKYSESGQGGFVILCENCVKKVLHSPLFNVIGLTFTDLLRNSQIFKHNRGAL